MEKAGDKLPGKLREPNETSLELFLDDVLQEVRGVADVAAEVREDPQKVGHALGFHL